MFGGGLGVLYSVTTISGPPLAVMLNNQGLAKNEFRAALGFIRLAESTFTAIAYWYAGLYSISSMLLIPVILPSVAIGVPIGAWLIRRDPRRNLPSRLYELRCLGGRLRYLDAPARRCRSSRALRHIWCSPPWA